MKISDIIKATGGRLLTPVDIEIDVTSFEIDSRKIKIEDFFVPIKGEHFNGENFAFETLENGAIGTLVTNISDNEIENFKDKIIIEVSDTLKALQDMAKYYRLGYDIPFIGITGSCGKTTTKEMIALALTDLNPFKTPGNLNSDIGLPLTLLSMKDEKIAVIEMGINAKGEMAKLAEIARPKYAVITNIGNAHIENFKTKENILSEKIQITNCFDKDSVLFINGDDELLRKLTGFNLITFGTSPDSDVTINSSTVSFSDKLKHELNKNLESFEFNLKTLNIHNALAAIAVAVYFGIPVKNIKANLESFKPFENRGGVTEINGITYINDTYNASYEAMITSISGALSFPADHYFFVLGDMLEVGEKTRELHSSIGNFLKNQNKDIKLITVGEDSSYINEGFDGFKNSLHLSKKETVSFLNTALKPGDVVLFKASRGIKLEDVIEGLFNPTSSTLEVCRV